MTWSILAFFIAACIDKNFGHDFSLLLGAIAYSSLFLWCIYHLYAANQIYYGWSSSRDDIIRFIFPSWKNDEEQETDIDNSESDPSIDALPDDSLSIELGF